MMLKLLIKNFVEFLNELQENAQKEVGNYQQPEYDFEFNHTI